MTDVRTGWVYLEVLRNNARVHMLAGLDQAVAANPYDIAGLDCGNGSEFINHEVMGWAADRLIFFARSRPYKKNDQATVESKNNHAVRKFGFHYRYDTDEERAILAALWQVVCLNLNYFAPTKNPSAGHKQFCKTCRFHEGLGPIRTQPKGIFKDKLRKSIDMYVCMWFTSHDRRMLSTSHLLSRLGGLK